MPIDADAPAASDAASDRADGPDRLWTTTVGSDLAFLLARANAVSIAGANAALRPFDLKVRSYSVLALAANGSRPSQKELADFLRLDPSQVVSLIDELEQRKLVRRAVDPSDRRAKVVVVTAAGRRLFETARDALGADEQERFAALSADERAALAAALRAVSLSA